MSRTVASHVAQRLSRRGMKVSPSRRFPFDLRWPCGTLKEGNPAFDKERQIRSLTK